MVGAAHTTTAHSIIYDTPAESRSSSARVLPQQQLLYNNHHL